MSWLFIFSKQLVCPSYDVPTGGKMPVFPVVNSNVAAINNTLGFMPGMITQSIRIALISFHCLPHSMSHPLCLPLLHSFYSVIVYFLPRASM